MTKFRAILLCGLAVLCLSLSVSATQYTATSSGHFNANATWGGSGHPGSGDTFTIPSGVSVTCDATDGGCTAGRSVASNCANNLSPDGVVQQGGTLTVGNGGTLTMLGELDFDQGSTLNITATSSTATLAIKPPTSGTCALRFENNAGSGTAHWNMSGASNSVLAVFAGNLANSGAAASIESPSGGSMPVLNWNWWEVNYCGSSSTACGWNGNDFLSSSASMGNGLVNNTNQFNFSSQYDTSISFTNVSFVNPIPPYVGRWYGSSGPTGAVFKNITCYVDTALAATPANPPLYSILVPNAKIGSSVNEGDSTDSMGFVGYNCTESHDDYGPGAGITDRESAVIIDGPDTGAATSFSGMGQNGQKYEDGITYDHFFNPHQYVTTNDNGGASNLYKYNIADGDGVSFGDTGNVIEDAGNPVVSYNLNIWAAGELDSDEDQYVTGHQDIHNTVYQSYGLTLGNNNINYSTVAVKDNLFISPYDPNVPAQEGAFQSGLTVQDQWVRQSTTAWPNYNGFYGMPGSGDGGATGCGAGTADYPCPLPNAHTGTSTSYVGIPVPYLLNSCITASGTGGTTVVFSACNTSTLKAGDYATLAATPYLSSQILSVTNSSTIQLIGAISGLTSGQALNVYPSYWNTAGVVYGTTAGYGTNDIHANPEFVDATRGMCKYYVSNGGAANCSWTGLVGGQGGYFHVTSASGTTTINDTQSGINFSSLGITTSDLLLVYPNCSGSQCTAPPTSIRCVASVTSVASTQLGISSCPGLSTNDSFSFITATRGIGKAFVTVNGFDYQGNPTTAVSWATTAQAWKWIRAGFAPQNATYATSADDGTYMGAVPVVSGPCSIITGVVAVGGGETQTYTQTGCGTGSWSVGCTGSGCAAGSINSSTGVYTGPTVSPQMYSRGCQLAPNDSIYVQGIAGQSVSTYNTQWMGRVQSDLNTLQFHNAPCPGELCEYDNVVPHSAPRQTYNCFEGGPNCNGSYLLPYPPYVEAESGWIIDPNDGLDNRYSAIDPTTCEYDQVYKNYVDINNQSLTAGSTTTLNFTSKAQWRIQNPLHVYAQGTTGTCTISSNNGGAGYLATVTQQPYQNSGNGQISIPFNSSSCTLTGTVITNLNPADGIGPSYNVQSAALFPLASNALTGGSNAAGTAIYSIHPEEVYNNVVNAIPDPNDSNKVTAQHHAIVTTTSNGMLSPAFLWPATSNAYSGHPAIPVTAITNSSTPKITLQPTCDGSCIAAVSPCSGNPQFSASWNNCTSPSGQQFDVVFTACTGNWTPLNNQHLLATYVDAEDFTVSFNTSSYGTYNGSCQTYFDWAPYGACYRLQSSFNCESICSNSSLTSSCPYEKAECRSFQTYCIFVTDGTTNSDTWDTDMVSTEFDPDFLHDVFGTCGDNPDSLGCLINCTKNSVSNFSNCLEIADISSLNVNGANDATTSNQRVQVSYSGSGGSASVDVVPWGTAVGLQVERIAIPCASGYAFTIPYWINGNSNTAATFAMSPSVSGASVSGSGVITPPSSCSSVEPTIVSVCSSAVSTSCSWLSVNFIPMDSDGAVRAFVGAYDGIYAGCSSQGADPFVDASGNDWWGPLADAGYERDWQSTYYNQQGLNFTGLFGSWQYNCTGWGSTPNRQLFGTGTQVVNDQIFTMAVPNGTYQVSILGEPGYETTGAGQADFDVETGGSSTVAATLQASNVDPWVQAGCSGSTTCYKGFTLGPYNVTVIDGMIHLSQRIRTYNVGGQYEGISISAIELSPLNTTLTVTTSSFPSGQLYVPYSQTAQASGGTMPYGWAVIGGSLPPGLSLTQSGTNAGLISGTPSSQGTFNFELQVTDSASPPHTATANLAITIGAAPPLTFSNGNPSSGEVGAAYSFRLTATGGSGSGYVYSIITGSLPAGLTLTASGTNGGLIAGTPTAAGTSNFTAKVIDSAGDSYTQGYSITIIPKPSITNPSLPSGAVGASYLAQLTESGGVSPYTYTVVSGTLPPGLTLASFNGQIAGHPTTAGTYTPTFQVKDGNQQTGTAQLQIVINNSGSLSINPITPPAGEDGAVYAGATFTASGGSGTGYTWCVLESGGSCDTGTGGALPVGLTLSSGGVLAGTPTGTPGLTSFTVKVTDSASNTATGNFGVAIYAAISITTTTLPPGLTYTAYSQPLAYSGGLPPVQWSVTSGSLPPGLTLASSTGVISGTPSASGTYPFTVQAVDSLNGTATASLSILVNSLANGAVTVNGATITVRIN